MVEAKGKSFHKQRSKKSRAPVICHQPVSLETEVPERPRPEDLLLVPDGQAHRAEISEINKRISRIKNKLAEKAGVQGKALPPLSELVTKKEQLQNSLTELHKQREALETKVKLLETVIS